MLLTLLAVLSLCGCSTEKSEPPEINYTSEILINKEMPDKSLVWEADIEAPAKGDTILPIGEYSTYAHITSNGIKKSNRRYGADMVEKEPYTSSAFDGFFENTGLRGSTSKALLKFLGMTQEEYDSSIGQYVDMNNFEFYSDTSFDIIKISKDGKVYPTDTPLKYAGKTLFIEYDYNTTYITAVDSDEIDALKNSDIKSTYEGRIGDKYYLSYGYYSFSKHTFLPYLSNALLPSVHLSEHSLDTHDLYRIVLNDAKASEFISKDCYAQDIERIGDRYHVILGESNRYCDKPIEEYEGSTLFYAIVDATTNEVVYLQKIFLKNYWEGNHFKLYSVGDDGVPYDVMLP